MSLSFYAQYDRPVDTDGAACREHIARWASFRKSSEHMFFAVLLEETLIGYIVFHKREEDCETGYCFHSAWHGRGFAKEAMTALLDALAANGITKVTAGTALANIPSVRLLTALGFRLVSTEQVSFYEDASGSPVYFTGGWFERIAENP